MDCDGWLGSMYQHVQSSDVHQFSRAFRRSRWRLAVVLGGGAGATWGVSTVPTGSEGPQWAVLVAGSSWLPVARRACRYLGGT